MVSVIIPVYNAERFLSDAVESVIAQSYNDWELILIDDGSSDQSAAICDRYASQHSNIKVLHQNNKGVSAARNVGIGVAQGEFLAFMDADDAIAPEYLQHLCDQQKKFNADLVGTWREFVNEDLQPIVRVDLSHDACYEADSLHLLVKKNPDFFSVVWGKLYRKNLINKFKIVFDESLSFSEDTLFILCYAAICKKILCDRKKLYFYRQHSNSLKNSASECFKQRIQTGNKFITFVNTKKPVQSYVHEIVNTNIIVSIRAMIDCELSLNETKNYLSILHNSIVYKKYLTLPNSNSHGIICLCNFIMRYIPRKLQALCFFALQKCKRFLRRSSVH